MPSRVPGSLFQSHGRVQPTAPKVVPVIIPGSAEVESEPASTKENLQCSTLGPTGDCSSVVDVKD